MRATRWARAARSWSTTCARTRATSICCCCSTSVTWYARHFSAHHRLRRRCLQWFLLLFRSLEYTSTGSDWVDAPEIVSTLCSAPLCSPLVQVPAWVTKRWLHTLSREYPTLAFHASLGHPFGKGALLSLLRQVRPWYFNKRPSASLQRVCQVFRKP